MKDLSLLSKSSLIHTDENHTKEIINELNGLLANEYALFSKTLNYHWNITGPRFHSLHNFLEDQYRNLLEVMDDVAERVRILGHTPYCTVEKMHEAMTISEQSGEKLSGSEMIADLYEGYMHINNSIRDMVSPETAFKKDPGTEDFLIGILKDHEKVMWMLKSHLD
jgi:starvation-inducible DNA-binding protein